MEAAQRDKKTAGRTAACLSWAARIGKSLSAGMCRKSAVLRPRLARQRHLGNLNPGPVGVERTVIVRHAGSANPNARRMQRPSPGRCSPATKAAGLCLGRAFARAWIPSAF